MGAFSNPLLTGIFGPLLGTTNETNVPTQSSSIAGEQQGLFSILNGMLSGPANDPTLAPQRNADSGAINRAYAGMPNTVTRMLASRGFGSSGKVGDGIYDTEGARLGAQSQLYGKYAEIGSNRQLSAAAIIEAMLRNNTGHSATNTKGSLAGLTAIQQLLKLLQGGGKLPTMPNTSDPSYGGGLSLPPYPGTPPTFPSYPSTGDDGSGYGYTRPSILYGPDNPANQTTPGGQTSTWGNPGWSGYVEGWGDNGYGDEE